MADLVWIWRDKGDRGDDGGIQMIEGGDLMCLGWGWMEEIMQGGV